MAFSGLREALACKAICPGMLKAILEHPDMNTKIVKLHGSIFEYSPVTSIF